MAEVPPSAPGRKGFSAFVCVTVAHVPFIRMENITPASDSRQGCPEEQPDEVQSHPTVFGTLDENTDESHREAPAGRDVQP